MLLPLPLSSYHSTLHVRILVERMDIEAGKGSKTLGSGGAVTEESMLNVLQVLLPVGASVHDDVDVCSHVPTLYCNRASPLAPLSVCWRASRVLFIMPVSMTVRLYCYLCRGECAVANLVCPRTCMT